MTAAHDDDLEEDGPRPRWWRRSRRDEHDNDGPGAEVVQLHKAPLVHTDDPPAPSAPSAARAWLTHITDRPFPALRQVWVSTLWWGGRLAQLIPWLPVLLLRELRPIARGVGRVASSWARWASAAELAAGVASAEGNTRWKAGAAVENTRKGRKILTLILVAAAAAGWVWLWNEHQAAAVVVLLLVVAVLDVVGRRGHPEERAPLLPAGPIVEGMSLSSLRAEVHQSFEMMGVEATIALPLPVEHGWTIAYHARQAIDDEYLRQVERDLNIRRNGITQIVERGHAARGELHVMLRDPLAATVDSPEHGPLSIYQPLPLGVTASGHEWCEHFLRTHFAVAGVSQSGKSAGIWQIVDVLRRCPEVELDAIDLTDGPAFSACRRAFRRRATDKATALGILTEAVALVKERAGELARLAEADDTPDDYDEKWQPTPAHPQRTVVMDEAARATEDDDLRPLMEYVLRYGAKTAVTLGQAWQGATTADSGSSIIRAMVMLRILFACTRDDVLRLFGKDARDAGYRPDLFEAANGASVNDAGKCFAMSSLSRTPEPRRVYRLDQAEVRRRDRQLGARTRGTAEVVEAVEVPPMLAAVEQAFRAAGDPDRMATAGLLGWLRDASHNLDADNVAAGAQLAEMLRPYGLRPEGRWRPSPGVNSIRGYLLADVRDAIRRLS